MKTKFITLFTVIILIGVIILPNIVLSATSNYYFEMSGFGRAVNGKANGVFYTIPENRTVIIKGSARIISSLPGVFDPPEHIYYTLYREITILPDKSFGTVNGGINRSFSGTFGPVDKTSDRYYLFVWRNRDDGHAVYGYGELSY
jgi:hypothetical protein